MGYTRKRDGRGEKARWVVRKRGVKRRAVRKRDIGGAETRGGWCKKAR